MTGFPFYECLNHNEYLLLLFIINDNSRNALHIAEFRLLLVYYQDKNSFGNSVLFIATVFETISNMQFKRWANWRTGKSRIYESFLNSVVVSANLSQVIKSVVSWNIYYIIIIIHYVFEDASIEIQRYHSIRFWTWKDLLQQFKMENRISFLKSLSKLTILTIMVE